jgi:hypothetical protein
MNDDALFFIVTLLQLRLDPKPSRIFLIDTLSKNNIISYET